MANDAAELRSVLRYAERSGVKVELREHTGPWRRHVTFTAPASAAVIDWADRTVWFADDAQGKAEQRCALVHEIVHVVVGVRPDLVDEVESGMLAIEHYVARSAKLSGWTEWMNNYIIDGGFSWQYASTQKRGAALLDSYMGAIRNGLIDDRTGRPTFGVSALTSKEG